MKFSSKKNKFLVWVVLIVLVIFLLNFFQKEVRGFFYSVSAPIQKVLWKAGESSSDFLEGIIRIGVLKQELDQLKLENQGLLAQLETLKDLREENKSLRQALEIDLEKDFKLSLAQVIAKDVSQDFILIDKGSEHGFSQGMPVITEQRILVGEIKEVYEKFSKVILISNKEVSFDAKIQKQERDISGVVKGRGNFKLLFDFILREEVLSQEDVVVTSAIGGIFPEGLLVGKIKQIKKIDVEPFQQAEIEPFFNISQAEILFIVLEFF